MLNYQIIIAIMMVNAQAARPGTSADNPKAAVFDQPFVKPMEYGLASPAARGFRIAKWQPDSRLTPWIRPDPAGTDVLLLARGGNLFPNAKGSNIVTPTIVYKYDGASGVLQEATIGEWLSGGTPIRSVWRWPEVALKCAIRCRDDLRFGSDMAQGRRAHFNDHPMASVGSVDLALIPVGNDRVTVLSARRYRAPGTYVKQAEIYEGCYFQQTFSNVTGEPLGTPLHLPLPVASGRPSCFTTLDEKYIMYFSESLDAVCVVSSPQADALTRKESLASVSGVFFNDDGEDAAAKSWQLGTRGKVTPTNSVLWIRADEEGAAVLLVRGSWDEPKGFEGESAFRYACRYDLHADTMTAVEYGQWDQAAGSPMKCAPIMKHGNFEIKNEYDAKDGPVLEGARIHYNGKKISTVGEVEMTLVPCAHRVIVLSALRCLPDGLWMSAGHRVEGCYFQQAFTKDGRALGEPLHLPIPPLAGFVQAGALPGGQHIVYYSDEAKMMCVVRLNRDVSSPSEVGRERD